LSFDANLDYVDMKNNEKEHPEQKRTWSEPLLFSFDLKNTKGGGDPNCSEDYENDPCSL